MSRFYFFSTHIIIFGIFYANEKLVSIAKIIFVIVILGWRYNLQ